MLRLFRPDFSRPPEFAAPRIGAGFLFFLSFSVLCSILAPRAMVFLPGLIGLSGFFVLYATSCHRNSSCPALPSRMVWGLVLAPVVLGALSLLWSADPEQAIIRAAKATAALLSGAFLVPLVQQISQQTLSRYGWILPFCVAFSCGVVALDLACGLPLMRLAAGVSPEDSFDPFHANRAIIICTLLFFPALGLLWKQPLSEHTTPNLRYFLCALFCMPVLGMLFLCESQSAQMAFLCGLLAMASFPLFHSAKGRIVLWAFLSLALCAAPWVAMAVFAPLAQTIEGHESLKELSAPQRLEIWDFIARRALERPLFGFGIDATRDMVFDTAALYHKGNTVLHPHDVALQIWIEFGAFGILCASAFLAFLIQALMSLPAPAARFGFGGFAAALSVAATGYGMWQGWWLGTLLTLTGWIVLLSCAAQKDCQASCQIAAQKDQCGS